MIAWSSIAVTGSNISYVAVGYVNQTTSDVENPLYSDSGVGSALSQDSLGRTSLNQFKNPLYDYAREVDEAAASSYEQEEEKTPLPPGMS